MRRRRRCRQRQEGKTARFRGAANTAKGNARYWDVQVSPINGEDGKPSHLLSISRDITEEWNAAELLKKNAERQNFLTAELQHRVKNMLATVMAIANRTFRGDAHEAPRQVFAPRLMTLSQAHDALTASNGIAPELSESSGVLWSRINSASNGLWLPARTSTGPEAGAGARVGDQRTRHERFEVRGFVEPSGRSMCRGRVGR